MDKFNFKGNLMILLTTLIWGTAFVAQSLGMNHLGPMSFIAARFLVGGLVALAALFIAKTRETPAALKRAAAPGAIMGLVLFVSCSLQQTGILYTSVGKAGFITSLYVVLVPVVGLFLGKPVKARIWAGVGLAMAGMYLLCLAGGLSVNLGDILVLCCAFTFTAHILLTDRFAPHYNLFALATIQFFTVSALALVSTLFFETPTLSGFIDCAGPILYTGALSSGVAYTLQIAAQKLTSPAVASILFSLEAVFSAVAAYFILGESFTPRELAGCVLVLVAIVTAQLPERVKD